MNSFFSYQGEDLLLRLYLQPKASRDKLVGQHGDELKIAITAPPIDGKANVYLLKYLSKLFGVAKSAVILEKGSQSRHKLVRIEHPKKLPSIFSE